MNYCVKLTKKGIFKHQNLFQVKFQDFKNHLSKLLPDYRSKRYLLAVSGGVDSMVLLDLFKKNELAFRVAHCHFGLRPDAQQEEDLVIKTCQSKSVKLSNVRFDTKSYTKKHGLSIQEAARKLRYNFFYQIINEQKLDFIVTAHHTNDNLETVIYKLVKGTGIRGIRGIEPIANKIFRPLLPFSKEDIYNYAKANKVAWLEDVSNKDNKYTRNLIRNKIVPTLKQINNSLEKSFNKTSDKLRAVEKIYNLHVKTLQKELITIHSESYRLDKSKVKKANLSPSVLEDVLAPYTISYEDCSLLLAKLTSHGQQFFSSNQTFILRNEREELVILKNKENEDIHQIWDLNEPFCHANKLNFKLKYQLKSIHLVKKRNHVYFDASQLNGGVIIRNWKKGDRFQPFGMKGTQKVSDLLINNKLSQKEKDHQLVIEYQGDIIWVVGLRAGSLYPILKTTSKILHIYFE